MTITQKQYDKAVNILTRYECFKALDDLEQFDIDNNSTENLSLNTNYIYIVILPDGSAHS